MTRHEPSDTPRSAAVPARPLSRLDVALESALLFILLSAIPLRGFISEIQTFETPRNIRTLEGPVGAMPATTFFIDAGIIALSFGALGLRAWRGAAYRRTGAEWGLGLLIIAAVISTIRAGQKHLAVIGSLDLLTLIFYFIALCQLLTAPWRVRLALAVVLATASVIIFKCGYQRFYEWPETVAYYESHKNELMAPNQATPGFIYDYEQRLKSGAATGYFNHPNVLASYLILIIMTALGAARERWRAGCRGTAIAPAVISGCATVALVLAQSKGAVAALFVALLIWLLARVFHQSMSRAPGKWVVILWLTLLFGAGAFAGTLWLKPDALGRSILFRTFYWSASGRLLADQGLGGIGANNFGRFFTRYKDVACPEDVEDPHSWLVRAAVEWGAIGLIGLIVVFVGISRRIARDARQVPPPHDAQAPPFGAPGPSIIMSSVPPALIAFGGWLLALRDASAVHLIVTLHLPLIAWFVAFVFSAAEGTAFPRFSGLVISALRAPIAAGLIAFLIHSGIDLAMFTSGSATLFWGLAAVCFSLRPCVAEVHSADGGRVNAIQGQVQKIHAAALLVVGAAAGIAIVSLLAVPSARLGKDLQVARAQAPVSANSPAGLRLGAIDRAANDHGLDATVLDESVDQLIPEVRTIDEVDRLLLLVSEFESRDPENARADQQRAVLYAQRFELAMRQTTSQASAPASQGSSRYAETQALPDLDRAIDAARRAVSRHPTNPSRHIFLADLLERRAGVSPTPELQAQFARSAATELQAALDLDAKRVYVSPLHRMPGTAITQIRERIRMLAPPPSIPHTSPAAGSP